MIELFRNKGSAVGRDHWSDVLKHEIAVLMNDRALIGRPTIRRLSNASLVLLFTLRTDLTADSPKADIKEEEPIALVYCRGLVGVEAPSVYSDRVDFPRSLPHLNPVPRTSPASICLAREGLQPHYERFGVAGVIDQLRRWMRDAKAGSLSRDGWEPVPTGDGSICGMIEGAEFQEFVTKNSDSSNWAGGIARFTSSGSAVYFQPAELKVGDHPLGLLSDVEKPDKSGVWRVPLIFAWMKSDAPGTDFQFADYTSDGTAWWDDLGTLSLDGTLRDALRQICALPAETNARPAQVVVIVGVRRPFPIIADRFGLSPQTNARSIELRAFLLSASAPADLLQPISTAREIVLFPWPSQRLLADISGFTLPQTKTCLIGYGALGSEIGAFLARMGVQNIFVIDPDRLHGHNLARHVGTVLDLGEFKSLIHSRQEQLASIAQSTYRGQSRSLDDLSENEFAQSVGDAEFLIDATANDRVRRSLPDRARKLGRRILRVELYDQGHLGVASVEGKYGNPDLMDLYHWLCQQGVSDPHVREWLDRESRDPADASVIATGFSCASASVRLPKWVVSAHASAFMPAITSALSGDVRTGVGLNPLSRERLPLGWKWFDIGPFDVTKAKIKGVEWHIRTAPDVFDRMRRLAEQSAPNETGGYLYGGLDLHLRRITVTAATPEPPGSKPGRFSLELAPAGHTDEEREIARHCGFRIALVGTWHSHPGGSSDMSGPDHRTARGFLQCNQARGLPTLIMICGADSVGVHVFA